MPENPHDHNIQTTNDTPIQVRSMRKRPFFWIANLVYERYAATIGLEGLGLYAALAKHADNTTGEAWPSLAFLAKRFHCDQRTIRTHLQTLVRAKLIAVQAREGQAPLITMLELPDDTLGGDPDKKCGGIAGTSQPVEPRPAPLSTRTPTEIVGDQDPKKTQEEKPREKPTFSSSFSTKEKKGDVCDETSPWSKASVPWTTPCPVGMLDAMAVPPEDYGALYHEAATTLAAEGVKAFCLTKPVIEARMSLLLEHRGRVQEHADGCLHEHVDTTDVCNDCGEVLVGVTASGDGDECHRCSCSHHCFP